MMTVEKNQVAVYDSVYHSLDAPTQDAITRKFKCDDIQTSKPSVIKLMNFQKQKGSKDCGLFAIAVITDSCIWTGTIHLEVHPRGDETSPFNLFSKMKR